MIGLAQDSNNFDGLVYRGVKCSGSTLLSNKYACIFDPQTREITDHYRIAAVMPDGDRVALLLHRIRSGEVVDLTPDRVPSNSRNRVSVFETDADHVSSCAMERDYLEKLVQV